MLRVIEDVARAKVPHSLTAVATAARTPQVGDRLGGAFGGRYLIRELVHGDSRADVVAFAHDGRIDRDVVLRFVRGDARKAARAMAALPGSGGGCSAAVGTLLDCERTFLVLSHPGDCVRLERAAGRANEAAQAFAIVREIADVLARAHLHGVAHGALSLPLVLLSMEHEVAVVAFGVAASEAATGADVAQAAAILYQLLTGEIDVPPPDRIAAELMGRRADVGSQVATAIGAAAAGDLSAAELRDRLDQMLCDERVAYHDDARARLRRPSQ